MIKCLVWHYFDWCSPRLGIAAGPVRESVAGFFVVWRGKWLEQLAQDHVQGFLGSRCFMQLLSNAAGLQ